ncbi:MAG: Glycerol-3-phosphate dehydrogenase [NAD(P)+] [Holosporales bacterium]
MIVIIGAGAYGTALAVHWAHHLKNVTLLTHSREQAATLLTDQENKKRLPGIRLTGLEITSDKSCLNAADIVFFALPAQAYKPYCDTLDFSFAADMIIGSKGIDLTTGQFLSDLLKNYTSRNISVWSGPQFAHEVAQNKPSAVTLASSDILISKKQAHQLATPMLKVYPSADVLAVELCGALKNVIAIACGIAKGRDLGENAIAALVTRGLAEMRRLGKALGAQDESFFELACIGDLMLTCSSLTSRNCSFGYALGKNNTHDACTLVEGSHTVKAAYDMAQKFNVYMPITTALYNILYHKKDIDRVIKDLLDPSYC